MKKTLFVIALVAGIASFAQNATAALIVNQSPGFSQTGDFFGTYSILPNADPYGGGFFLIQNAAVPGYYDEDEEEFVDDQPAYSILSSYSDSHFSFASLNAVVDSTLVPPSNTGINPTNGTYYIAFDVVDQLNGNAVYFGWMNVTVQGVDTMDPITFTLNEWAYDNTGASILVGQTAAGGAAVPEPGTWAAAALLAGGAAFMRWRKRAKVS